MPVTKDEAEQLMQTGALIGVANALLVPVYMENKQAGASASVALTAGLLYFLHSQGEKNRQKEKNISNSFSFWSAANDKKKSDSEEVFTNVLNGAGHVYKNFESLLKKT